MSEANLKSPKRNKEAASDVVAGMQEIRSNSVPKSPRKPSTPVKSTAKSPPKKTSAKKASEKKLAIASADIKDVETLQRENSELLTSNKDLQQKVKTLQKQVSELRTTIKSMKQAKNSSVPGTVKGFGGLSAPSSAEDDGNSSQRTKSNTSLSPKKSSKIVESASSTEFLPVIPWKHVLKKHYANSSMMPPKSKLEFRDAIQSFLEDNLGRKTEIKCRFIDDAGHVDIGIPENLIEKFIANFNKKVNAPKQTREEELEAIVKSGGSLPKRRLTVTSTSEKSPVKRKNVKLVTA